MCRTSRATLIALTLVAGCGAPGRLRTEAAAAEATSSAGAGEAERADELWQELHTAFRFRGGEAALALVAPGTLGWLGELRSLALDATPAELAPLDRTTRLRTYLLRALVGERLNALDTGALFATLIAEDWPDALPGLHVDMTWQADATGGLTGGDPASTIRLVHTDRGLLFDGASLAHYLFPDEVGEATMLDDIAGAVSIDCTTLHAPVRIGAPRHDPWLALGRHLAALTARDPANVRATVSTDTIAALESIRIDALDDVGAPRLLTWRVRQALPSGFLASATAETLLERIVRDGLVQPLLSGPATRVMCPDERTTYFVTVDPETDIALPLHIARHEAGRWGFDWTFALEDVPLHVPRSIDHLGDQALVAAWPYLFTTAWSEALRLPLREIPAIAADPPLSEMVTRRLQGDIDRAVERCRARHLSEYPQLAGRIDLRATVGDGALRDVALTHIDLHVASARQCLVDAVSALPTPELVAGTRLNLPVVLRPTTP
ncbi:MAG: hypothetical protein H6726_02770 [Sandaracinaceae bacterium]|nr:hypothetical protein [Myxococcales bacterium]MCB9656547.1 hypothetical protein [Sandaracinaceae bacterium]